MTDQPAPATQGPTETTVEWPKTDPAAEPAPEPGPAAPQQGEQRKPAGGRPPLPKRVPQANLAEGLRDDPDQDENVVATPSKLAGFRRAFRGGFDDAPNERS